MKSPMRNRFTTLSFLCISSLVLIMMGLTLSSLLTQAPSEWEWGNIAACTGSLALCLMLFLLFRAHTQSLTEVAQRSQALAEKITEHKRAEEALAERTARLEAVRDVAVEITRELDLTTLLGLIIRRAVELVGTQSGVVYLWDEASQTLIPRAWHGFE